MIRLRRRTVAGSCPSGAERPIRAAPRVGEMTIERHCHAGHWNPGLDSAIAAKDAAKRPLILFQQAQGNFLGFKRWIFERPLFV